MNIRAIIAFPVVLTALILGVSTVTVSAQPSEERPLSPEGIFLSWNSFLKHTPDIQKSQIVSEVSTFTMRSKVKCDSIPVRSGDGRISNIQVDDITCLYEGNTLYIIKGHLAHRASMTGMLIVYNESYPVIKAPFSPVAVEQTREVTPHLFDLAGKQSYDYTVEGMQRFLDTHDEQLGRQFTLAGTRKQRRLELYHYAELYNERHPLP